VGSCLGVDQLGGDAHTVARISARYLRSTYSHTELAPDLLHVDGTTL
jgi:hypothetical protein